MTRGENKRYVRRRTTCEKLAVDGAHAKLLEVISPALCRAAPFTRDRDEHRRAQARAGEKAERFSSWSRGTWPRIMLLQATALGLVGVPGGRVDEPRRAAHGLV